MADPSTKPSGPAAQSARGHPMPRRATPEQSVTLRHHRLAREASQRPPQNLNTPENTRSPRRNSSGESHDTRRSDPQSWFDSTNRNPAAAYGPNNMDIDPPFFQKRTDSSNSDSHRALQRGSVNYPLNSLNIPGLATAPTQSSSADDFRSVIDDLTVENKRLKEELKRFKQFGPGLLRKDKLFEIKVHGLPARKKRELENTLRDFAASLEGSSEATSQRKKSSKHAARGYSYGGSNSKHASSSSSRSRPVDSAYASASIGPASSGTSLTRPSMSSRARSSEQKVENYLQDIPAGLYPGMKSTAFSDSEKKKLVVKKLEQLFTGKITNRSLRQVDAAPCADTPVLVPTLSITESSDAIREAQMQPQDAHQKKMRSRDNVSSSDSNGNHNDTTQIDTQGSGSGSGSGRSGNNTTPPNVELVPEQRPTRPRDLDPDRVQVPSENMDYIRHLGLVPPELLKGTRSMQQDVSPDADGWVYLNLLSNLAQLHIFNVSPDFIRKAVVEKSSKFQLSPDGRKIRWRGGTEGTRFSSDSSGDNSMRSPSSDGEDDGSDKNGLRKRQKTNSSGQSSKDISKFGAQVSGSSESFHYKPLFVHQSSSMETSIDDSESLDSYQVEDSNGNDSRWGWPSGSGSTPRRRKRRADGAMVFYSGAPFCIDLSADRGETSPTTYMTSTGQQESEHIEDNRPFPQRSLSGSSLAYRPFGHDAPTSKNLDVDIDDVPDLTQDDESCSDDMDCELPWCDDPEQVLLRAPRPTLETSGLGGVSPDDHFAMVVITRRRRLSTKQDKSRLGFHRLGSEETTDSIVGRLATMTTSSPRPTGQSKSPVMRIEIEYVSGRLQRLKPVTLPPPIRFIPPLTETSVTGGTESEPEVADVDESEGMLDSDAEESLSKKANPHQSDNTYPDGEDLSSGDEEDEHEEDDEVSSGEVAYIARHVSASRKAVGKKASDSSVATAGGAGTSDEMEEDS